MYKSHVLLLAAFSCVTICVQIAFPQDGSIKELRDSLRFKFALDFALKNIPETAPWHSRDNLYEKYPPSNDTTILESFACNALFNIYQIKSFDGRDKFYLLDHLNSRGGIAYLLSGDTLHSHATDSLELGQFIQDTLNGGNILRCTMTTTGSGWLGNHLFLVSIRDGRFIQQFHCYTGFHSMWDQAGRSSDSLTRGLGSVKFQDLNGDGYADIQYELIEDIVDLYSSEPGHWTDEDFKKESVIRNVSSKVERYIWNTKTLTFDQIQ